MDMSLFSISSLLLLMVASLDSVSSSSMDVVGISQRLTKHTLSSRRDLGPTDCPWGSPSRINGVDSCCEDGVADPLCCPLNGETQCFCREQSHPHRKQSNQGESNGCGSESFFAPLWVQQAFALEFADLCDSHDECYTDCEKTHKQCDIEFYNAGMRRCEDAYWSTWNPLYWSYYWPCVGRLNLFTMGLEDSSAWLESIVESCYCSAHENLVGIDDPLGCYQDRSDRQLDVNKGRLGSTSMREFNSERCWNECEGYAYYALQDGGHEHGAECWCGQSLKKNEYDELFLGRCRNEKGFTGGPMRNLVFPRHYRG